MALTKRNKLFIENICGDIYDVGYTHGSNAFRNKPKKVNIGWDRYSKKLMNYIEKIK